MTLKLVKRLGAGAKRRRRKKLSRREPQVLEYRYWQEEIRKERELEKNAENRSL